MSKISTYEVAPSPKLSDKLIGTSVGGEIEDVTYNFTLQELLDLFLPIIPANNLQGVLDYGNTATQDINLFGTITTTNLEVTDTANLFITYLNEETHIVGSLFDSVDSIGEAGQVLTSTGEGVAWFTLPPIFTPNLQQVLTEGNTAEIDILLDANIQALDVSSNTASVGSQLTIQGVVVDYTESVGSSGQVLSSTSTNVEWVNLPVYSATSPLLFNSATGVFSIQVANSTQGGYLTANDWITFNGKQNAGSYITALTGEATANGPGSVPITLNNASVISKVLTGLNITGGSISASDSILTAFGKVQSQINGLMGGVQYQGTWNAATNTPTLTSSVGTQGHYYIVNVEGNTDLNGITDWKVGDWAIFSGGVWQKVDNTDSVTSVNGQTGAVSLTTDNIPEGVTNLYFLDSRARAAVSATTPLSYNNTTGVFSIQQASGTQNGYLSSADWTTFNSKQDYLGGTGLVKSTAGTITYITDNSSNWNTAYNRSIVSAAVTGTGTKTLTLTEQDGNTLQASWSDADTGLTSVGLSMPSAFTVSNSPLTSNGTIGVTGAGTTAQYIRGDGSLATFPSIISEAQNLVTEVYNNSGATLTKGTVVYINGGQGNLPTITKAIATGDATSAQTYGVVQSDITNMNNGYVVVSGRLEDLDTRDYTPGQQLYLSSTTAGAWTPTKQYAPAHLVYIAIVVRAHPTQGVVEVMIQNGYEMDELHNVSAQNPNNNAILQYKTSTALWTSVDGTTTNIAEGTNLYYLDSRARAAISLTTTGSSGAATYDSITGIFNIPNYGSALTGYVPYTGATANVNLGIYNLTASSLIKSGGTSSQFLKADGSVDSSAYIVLGSLSASAPLSYNNLTGAFSISQASATTNGYLSSTDWNTFNSKQEVISLTTTGSSGASTLVGTTLNVPTYTLSGLGGVPTSRTLTINGTQYDLSADRSWSVGTVTSVAALTLGTSGTDLNSSVATGTTTPVITLNVPTASAANRGALSAADWSTFNTKVGSVTATTPLASSGGSTPNITIQQASGSQNGYLSSTDWTTFNNKQASGNYITSLTGEATASGPGAASVTLNNASVTAKVLTGINITGGTVQATDTMLTAFGKLQNQINGLVGGSIYQGTWNAATNTPALASGIGTKGYYYIVSVAGTTNLDGITDWFVGDWAIFDGTAWQQVDNTDAVVSVNGQTGAVSLTTDNIPEGATNLYYLDSRARAALSFTAGSGAYNSTTGVITIPTNTNQLTNGASFITLASLSGTAPIGYNNTTGAISITQAGTASDGYLSSTDWNTFNNKQATISLTTTGTSGAATLVGTTLNIPQYQGALTNPVTGTGLLNRVTKFDSNGSTVTYGLIYDDGSSIETNAYTYITKTLIPRQAVSYETNFKSLIGATPGWIYLGNLGIPQHGYNACITMDAGAGYNAALSQMGYLKLHIRTSNTTPSGGFYFTAFAEQFGYANFIQEIRITENISTNTYGIYVYSNTFIGIGYYKVEGSGIEYIPVETATAPPATYYQVPLAFTINSSTTINNTLDVYSNLYVAGTTTLNTAVGTYAATITNVQDSSEGLLVRATDNDSNLYLLRLQSSNTTTGQTWVDRFTVAKDGASVFSSTVRVNGGELTVYSGASVMYTGVDTGNSYVYLGTNTTGYGLSLQASGERIRIFNNGNVVVSSSPVDAGYKFDVAGTGRFRNDLTIGGDGNTQSSLYLTRLQGYSNYYDATNRYGNYGKLIFNADNSWTSASRRWLITNAVNNTNFAIIRSVDANTDPSLGNAGSVTSGTVDFQISNSGVTTLSNLAGTGTRIVVADASGTLSASSALSGYISGSGTTNYLPKFTGTSTIGNSIVQDNSTGIIINGVDNFTPQNGGWFFNGTGSYTSGIFSSSSSTVLTLRSPQTIIFEANGNLMRLDASGNLGLGVTPSAWVDYKGFQIGNQGSIGATSTVINFSQNVYYGASGNSYIENGKAAMYQMNDGVHGWRIAGTGTAGNAISFTQAMTLFSTGNLGVGVGGTDAGYKLDVSGTLRVTGNLTGSTASFSSYVTMGSLVVNDPGAAYYSFTNRIGGSTAINVSGYNVTTELGKFLSSGLSINSTGGATNNMYQIAFGYKDTTGVYASSAIAGITESSTGYNTGALVFATRSATTDVAPTIKLRIAASGTATFSSNIISNSPGGGVNAATFYDRTGAVGAEVDQYGGLNAYSGILNNNGNFSTGSSGTAYVFKAGAIQQFSVSATNMAVVGSVTASGLFSSNISSLTYEPSSAGAIQPGVSEFISTGFNIAASGSTDVSTISLPSNTQWKAIITGGFANNWEGGGLVSPTFSRDIDGTNCTIVAGSTTITFSRNATTGKLQATNSNASARVTFAGTIHLVTFPQSSPPSNTRAFFGNVGVNTTNPTAKLQVEGNSILNGNVSINTTYNGFALNVSGVAYIIGGSAWVQNGYGYVNSGATSTGLYPMSDNTIQLRIANSTAVTVSSSSNVLINTTTDSGYRLDVNGTLKATGIITPYQGFTYQNGIINVTGGAASWILLGTLSIAQGGHTAVITIEGGSGYNADENQNGSARIFIRTSNGSPNGAGWYYSATLSQMGYNAGVAGSCIITQTNATTYNVYVYFGQYSGNTYYKVEGSNFSWTASNSNYGSTAPTGGQTLTNVFKVISTATFASSVTASSFFESSDSRLKQLIKDNYKAIGIDKIKPKLYIKDGREEVGYFAQDVKDVLSTAISVNDAGFLSLSYTQVHTAKIAIIEDEMDVLKRRVTELESKLQKYEA